MRGSYSVSVDLQPKNSTATTYQVTVSFEGDERRNATAYSFMLTEQGTQFAPPSNSAISLQ